jgi:hypothetical protein
MGEDGCACFRDCILCSGFGLSQQNLEFGEDLLNRIEVARVFGEEDEETPTSRIALCTPFPCGSRDCRITTPDCRRERTAIFHALGFVRAEKEGRAFSLETSTPHVPIYAMLNFCHVVETGVAKALATQGTCLSWIPSQWQGPHS